MKCICGEYIMYCCPACGDITEDLLQKNSKRKINLIIFVCFLFMLCVIISAWIAFINIAMGLFYFVLCDIAWYIVMKYLLRKEL